MSDLNALIAALQASDRRSAQANASIAPLQQRMTEANTKRATGLGSLLLESAWDGMKRKRTEPAFKEAMLEQAMAGSQADAVQAQIQAEIQRLQEAEKRATELAKEDAKHSNAVELYRQQAEIDNQYARPSEPPAPPETIRLLKAADIDPASPEGRAVIMGKLNPQPRTSLPAGYGQSESGGLVPLEGSPAAQRAQEQAEQKAAADRTLMTEMSMISEMMRDPNFPSAVGPTDAGAVSRFAGKHLNTDAYQLRRKIDRVSGERVLKVGAEVLKGSQTEGEWDRVAGTMPSADDHPEVWRQWFDDAISLILAGRPDLEPQLGGLLTGGAQPQPQAAPSMSAYEEYKRLNGLQ